MSFLLPLALLLGLTAIFPLIAHALRRGQARPIEFPAARFVPSRTTAAKERHRVEDKWLLLLRTLLLLCLAALAASPFVQCSRLSLSRTDGASLSGVLVIDDSASMRAIADGGDSRLEKAIKSANELILSAQPGDSFAIVLAGQPARVLTPPTTELEGVREALAGISASDRETDLGSALTLARSLLSDVPQKDRPLVLLSDMAISPDENLNLEGVIIPDAGLSEKFENCALVSAVQNSDAIQIETACTSPLALQGRFIELFDKKNQVTGKPIQAGDGVVRMPLEKKGQDKVEALRVRLTAAASAEADVIADDDSCLVLESANNLTLAVRADQARAGLKTGAGTVLQAGLEALERNLRVETMSLLPDQSADLNRFAGLLIDDPSGFTPEVREALQAWVQEGGVGVLLLGEGINRTPLGSDFSPFLSGAPTWTRTDAAGASKKEAGSLGPLTTTWADIDAKFRATLGDVSDAEKKVSWDDGQPLIIERLLGRGLLLTITLPSSVDTSDLALRPAFLEFLDYVVSQAAIRRGAQATLVGQPWRVATRAVVTALDVPDLAPLASQGGEQGDSRLVEPPLAGKYLVRDPSGQSFRYAMRHRQEHVRQPQQAEATAAAARQEASLSQVGISREIALLALLLSALELGFRALQRSRPPQGLPLSA